MEDAMGVVVTQAGNVSEQMGQVLGKIEHEARKSQKATTLALLVGGLSLFVSAVAFVASLYFSRVGFAADRAEAKASDAASAKVVEQLEAQNRLSRQLVDEQRKARPAPTPSTVQPASAARPARRRSPAAN
jgi:hypothetical protein